MNNSAYPNHAIATEATPKKSSKSKGKKAEVEEDEEEEGLVLFK